VLSLPPTMRVFVATRPTDMRKSFDGLVALTRGLMKLDPLSGHLYAFFNRRRTMMKAVYWDRNGYVLVAKRLEKGTFVMPIAKPGEVVELEAAELALIVEGIDLSNARRRPRWEVASTWAR
jgi:transposase